MGFRQLVFMDIDVTHRNLGGIFMQIDNRFLKRKSFDWQTYNRLV